MPNSKVERDEVENRKVPEERFRELTELAGRGDAKAYRELLKEIERIAKHSLFHRILDAALLDEVVQEILLSVHRSLHTYDPTRPFGPWLNAIIQYRLKDFFRTQYRKPDAPTREGHWESLPSPTEAGFDEPLQERLEAAIDKLSAVQRRLFVMLKLEGRSVREAARELGMSESATKVSAHRAYEKVKTELSGDEHEH